MVGVTLLVANIGSGTGAHLGAARLLYGMGRSNALPAKFFGYIDPQRHVPRNNVIFVGVIALVGSWLVTYSLGAEMLNFGALIAFMGVNLAAFTRYFVRGAEKKVTHLLPPLLGFAICLLLWLNLSLPAKIAGGVWLAAGLIYGAIKTRGFRSDLVNFEISGANLPVSGASDYHAGARRRPHCAVSRPRNLTLPSGMWPGRADFPPPRFRLC